MCLYVKRAALISISAALFFFFACSPQHEIDPQRMTQTVAFLCDSLRQGRPSGTGVDSVVSVYLAQQLKDQGYVPLFDQGALHPFTVRALHSYNMVMVHRVKGATATLLLGAHYDHLGMGGKGSGSLMPDTNAIHYGADDNASGVALMMELARVLAADKSNRVNLIAAAFGAEERGLFGSAKLADTLASLGLSPQLMLNFDMVGRLKDSVLQVGGIGTFTQGDSLLQAVSTLSESLALKIKSSRSGYGPSDYSSFYRTKVPVLFFSTGAHGDYHTPKDTPDKLNWEGMEAIGRYVLALSDGLLKGHVTPQYVDEPSPEPTQQRAFKVSLGVIPDLAYDGEGFCAGTIIHGRPSQRAGMQDGDVVVQMDNTLIRTIDDYMAFLSTLEAGQKITITVLRHAATLTLDVQL